MSSKKDKELLDEVRDVLRLKHYSIHTERSFLLRLDKKICPFP